MFLDWRVNLKKLLNLQYDPKQKFSNQKSGDQVWNNNKTRGQLDILGRVKLKKLLNLQ
jgi:hypothetical protein